jgi:hypothetical protein
VNKDEVLAEIKRTTAANGGKALGIRLFEQETGIKKRDWYPHIWLKWLDAQKEAGVSSTALNKPTDLDYAVSRLADLIREIGHFPIQAELLLKRQKDKSFPSESVFRRLGGKSNLDAAVVSHCTKSGELNDVAEKCFGFISEDEKKITPDMAVATNTRDGFFYLMKWGKFYKIWHTNNLARRSSEIKIEMPDPVETIHSISTDDPSGIEAYWHSRFKDKIKNGEWFELNQADVRAFKRRKNFM